MLLLLLLAASAWATCPAPTKAILPVRIPIKSPSPVGLGWDFVHSGFNVPIYGDSRLSTLTTAHPEVTTFVIVVHGSSRNPADHFTRVCNGAEDYGDPSSDMMIIAPHFQEPEDSPDAGEVFWELSDERSGDDWREGGNTNATSPTPLAGTQLSSYTVLDMLVDLALQESLFPNMSRIVVTGHSAGGQVVQRWGMVSWLLVHRSSLRIEPIIAPGNPSTYAYLDNKRPDNIPTFPPNICPTDYGYNHSFTFAPVSGSGCDSYYNWWKYGLDRLDRTPYLSVGPTALEIQAAYRYRHQVSLLGEEDTCNEVENCCPVNCSDYGLATSCSAMVQGGFRLVRGIAHAAHVKQYYGEEVHVPSYVVVPGVGHSSTSLYQTSTESRDILFGVAEGATCSADWHCRPPFVCTGSVCAVASNGGTTSGGSTAGGTTEGDDGGDADSVLSMVDENLVKWKIPGGSMAIRIGIVGGGLLLVVAACVGGCCCYRIRQKKRRERGWEGAQLDSLSSSYL